MAIKIAQGFDRTAGFPIDSTLVLTKAEMLAMDDDRMPAKYFALCSDDNNMYVYDKASTPSAETGKFIALDGGGDKTFFHEQMTPAASWTIIHNLNKYPAVSITDSAGTIVTGDVQYIDENSLVITFQSAFAGKAYLN